MMYIVAGNKAGTITEAARLALDLADKGDMSPEVARLFVAVTDGDRPSDDATRSITSAVRGRYGRSATWSGRQWFIPVPQIRFDALPIPLITVAVQLYLVAAIAARGLDGSYRLTVIGPIGKEQTLLLPIALLQAILDDDLDGLQVVGRDGSYTTWTLPGMKAPLRLPDGLIAGLQTVLSTASVTSWLRSFGSDGESIAPHVVGSFLGLQHHGLLSPVPTNEQPFRRDIVIGHLTRMYGSAVAADMFERAAPFLKSTMTNDETLKFILNETGRR